MSLNYSLRQDGGWYVIDELSGEAVSPALDTRERAHDVMTACDALSKDEQRRLRAGVRPAPGCEWLFARQS